MLTELLQIKSLLNSQYYGSINGAILFLYGLALLFLFSNTNQKRKRSKKRKPPLSIIMLKYAGKGTCEPVYPGKGQ